MGRPKLYGDRVSTNVRLPVDLYEQLVAAADERNLSVNYLVTAAVRELLDNLIPVDELRLTRP